MRIGVYVGSFNPVHKEHTKISNYLLDNDYIDKIIIIPTGNYWDKTDLIDVKYRIEMLKYYENNQIIIDSSLSHFQYTYQILEELKKIYKNDEIFLIIGADNLEKFYLWKNVDSIFENKILVLPRDNVDILAAIQKYQQKDKFVIINNFVGDNISATLIRNKIKAQQITDLLNFVDEDILQYIINNNLYE